MIELSATLYSLCLQQHKSLMTFKPFSGVAIGYPGLRNILAPSVIKSAEFEVKNRCKSAEAKAEHALESFLSFLDCNETHLTLEMNSTKFNSESNDVGVWRRSPQPLEANGGSGAKYPTLRRFLQHFFQKYAFLGKFSLNLCLKQDFDFASISPNPTKFNQFFQKNFGFYGTELFLF